MRARMSCSSRIGSASWRASCWGSSRSRSPPATFRWSRTRRPSPICSLGWLARLEPVDLLQDVDRLATELAVESLEVPVGELAGGVVGLGVADLPVLRRLARLQVGELRDGGILRLGGLALAKGRGHEPSDQHDDGEGEYELHAQPRLGVRLGSARLGGGPQLATQPRSVCSLEAAA